MKTFAFIINPISLEQLKDFWPAIKIVPDFIIRSSLKNIPPFKIAHIKKFLSSQGGEIDGYLILCPLLPKQIQELGERHILDKIIAAGQLVERLGAKILGLGRCAPTIPNIDYIITENLKIPVTNGNSYTAWSIFEGIYRVAKLKMINLKNSTLTIIGATTSIGKLCAKKLADYVSGMVMVDKEKNKLEQFKEEVLRINPIEITIEEDTHKAIKDSDIIINLDNSSESIFDLEELKPNAIALDASLSRNIAGKIKSSSNITVIEGGLIKLPYPTDLEVDLGLPKDIIPASLAETMLLALEERFTNYSLGDNINLDKLEEIANFAAKHGFEVWVPQAPVR
jgi:predicted amino acid dehydrogenase